MPYLNAKPLQLLHMDLFCPTKTTSLGGNRYAFVVVDDYSHFTWVLFVSSKKEAINQFLYKKNQNKNESLFLKLEVIVVENLRIMNLKILANKLV